MTLEFSVPHDVDADASPAADAPVRTGFRGWLDRQAARRAAIRRRQLETQLAELRALEGILSEAREIVERGWIQHAWFSFLDERGRVQRASSAGAVDVVGRPLVGACLLGSVVSAAGGPAEVHAQPVQRAIDLLWHALIVAEGSPVLWCPAPDVRMSRVRDLTSWNDAPTRVQTDVASLLLTAERLAVVEGDRIAERVLARAR